MGRVLFSASLLWGIAGFAPGWTTAEGLLCGLIAAVFTVGGAIVFAINDAAKSIQQAKL